SPRLVPTRLSTTIISCHILKTPPTTYIYTLSLHDALPILPYTEADFYHKDGRNRQYNSYILESPDYSPPAAYTSAGTQYKAAGKYSLCTLPFYEGLKPEGKYTGSHPDISA